MTRTWKNDELKRPAEAVPASRQSTEERIYGMVTPAAGGRTASRYSDFVKNSFRRSSKIAVYKLMGVL